MTGDEPFPVELLGYVWHTTSPRLYDLILQSGSILPNPDIPESERWKTSRGPEYYPYVRVLGGVSLFDFRAFDPITYSERYPVSSWREFVPYRPSQCGAIWMQIDTDSLGDAFLDGQALKAKQTHAKAYQHTLMPAIEAAHVGPLPLSAIRRVLRIGPDSPDFIERPGFGAQRSALLYYGTRRVVEEEFASVVLVDLEVLRAPSPPQLERWHQQGSKQVPYDDLHDLGSLNGHRPLV